MIKKSSNYKCIIRKRKGGYFFQNLMEIIKIDKNMGNSPKIKSKSYQKYNWKQNKIFLTVNGKDF